MNIELTEAERNRLLRGLSVLMGWGETQAHREKDRRLYDKLRGETKEETKPVEEEVVPLGSFWEDDGLGGVVRKDGREADDDGSDAP